MVCTEHCVGQLLHIMVTGVEHGIDWPALQWISIMTCKYFGSLPSYSLALLLQRWELYP